jgi:phage baseplate assembly protein W
MNLPDGRHLSFPFRIGLDGRTAQIGTLEEHVRDELVQLLLTNLGERVFLPDFGGDARRLVFENIDEPLQAMTKAALTDALNRWLGQRIVLELLTVKAQQSTIDIEIKYRLADTSETRVLHLQHEGGGLG